MEISNGDGALGLLSLKELNVKGLKLQLVTQYVGKFVWKIRSRSLGFNLKAQRRELLGIMLLELGSLF